MFLGWKKLFLILTVLPTCRSLQVSIPEEEYEIASGGDVTLTCSFVPALSDLTNFVLTWEAFPDEAGDPLEPVATYFMNNAPDIAPPYEGRATLNVNIDQRTSSLLMSKVSIQDSRRYQCSVLIPNDNEGTTAVSTSLLVLVPPSAPICSIQGTAEYFHDISLTCNSKEGSPTPTYDWKTYSVESVPRPFPPKTNIKDGSLSLFNISKETSGYFICISVNRIGSASCNLTLAVMPLPPSAPICSIQGTAEYFHDISLTCSSKEGSPTPTYDWKTYSVESVPRPFPPKTNIKDGSLSLFNISKEMSGYFICTSVNRIGSASCNLTLAVMPPSSKVGATAGIIAGVVAGILLLLIVLYCFCRKKGKKDTYEEGSPAEMEFYDKDAPETGKQYADNKSDSGKKQANKNTDNDIVPEDNNTVRRKLDDDQDSFSSNKDSKGGDMDSNRYKDDRNHESQDPPDRYGGSRDRLNDQHNYNKGSRDRLDDQRDQSRGSRDRLDDQRDQYRGSRDRLDDQRDHYRGSRDRLDNQHDQYRGSRDRLDDQRDQYRGSRDRLDDQSDHNRGSRDRLDDQSDHYRGSRDRLDDQRDQYRGSRDRLDDQHDRYHGSRDRFDHTDEHYRSRYN
ncbi:cell surface A33 antigen isoform X2 [Gouania willdenowi]|uniref:cell surface A33 antigen isoform X2 n=1 Tax=Gouania willdenowi TaxID=441366 RepID=UPI0010561F4A|nr:cell surface A33 antigen-like isoform X2 [Gouania willdenowi]